ncbi:16973_t:CDS:2 [Funneliformis caledonium]|uniref:16973_t:CDS:1 n=1 Tax=Funneliformis caledonium TaxID=1117310 RepID=A0A9N8V4S4_9GLOM|nr:16973_t:CDS:2 [Funneliformis caledonium]
MFERLAEIVKDYNNSNRGRAVLQEYDMNSGKAFILCIVTNLICQVHEKIQQAGELCYIDASFSFESLNTSITLFFTSYTVRALPFRLFITSDELEITLEKAINLLKTILLPYAFFGHGPQVGSMVFLTDDLSAEHNALELC